MKNSYNQLKIYANELRQDTMEMGPRSGYAMHIGPAYSMADFLTVLYYEFMHVDPKNPEWEDRDRLVLSKGHAAPILYALLAKLGFYEREVLWDCKHVDNILQGHPSALRTVGIDATSGSLGNGLGIALGMAMAAKRLKKKNKVYCIIGDGEVQEGMILEAMLAAPAKGADNLIAIVDYNHHQSSGSVEDIVPMHSMAKKWEDFGWRVFEIDAHNIEEIYSRLSLASNYEGRPTCIIAHSIKGKGVSFIEHNNLWHAKMPTKEEYVGAMNELQAEWSQLTGKEAPGYTDYDWMRANVNPEPGARKFDPETWDHGTLSVLGSTVLEMADENEKITVATGDAVGSMGFRAMQAKYPDRVYNVGIQEQNSMGVASGLASTGLKVVQAGFAPFMSMRAIEQFRTFIAYPHLDVTVMGAMGGVTAGSAGPTHQSYEDYGIYRMMPGTVVGVPCDAASAKEVIRKLLSHDGPAFVRIGTGPAEKVYNEGEVEFEIGKANILQDGTDLTVISCGPVIVNALRAVKKLEAEGKSVRVINMMSIKPIDKDAIIAAAKETGAIVTVEEHQIAGGLGAAVAEIVSENCPVPVKRVGFLDTVARTGDYYALLELYHMGEDDVYAAAQDVLARK